MSQSQPYVYRPLDQSRREIRLIKVLNIGEIFFTTEIIESDPELYSNPARVRAIEDDIPLRCAISQVSLEDRPLYAALSYTWGDASTRRWWISEPQMAAEVCQLGTSYRLLVVTCLFCTDQTTLLASCMDSARVTSLRKCLVSLWKEKDSSELDQSCFGHSGSNAFGPPRHGPWYDLTRFV
jgi:hypothetical protein